MSKIIFKLVVNGKRARKWKWKFFTVSRNCVRGRRPRIYSRILIPSMCSHSSLYIFSLGIRDGREVKWRDRKKCNINNLTELFLCWNIFPLSFAVAILGSENSALRQLFSFGWMWLASISSISMQIFIKKYVIQVMHIYLWKLGLFDRIYWNSVKNVNNLQLKLGSLTMEKLYILHN